MDGTLVDSEPLTEPVIRAFCDEAGLGTANYRWAEFHGVSWQQVARRIASDYLPNANIADMAWRLHELWAMMCAANPPVQVPGARDAVVAAHASMPTAIVSSAYRASIDTTIRQMGLEAHVSCRAGADDYANSKPAPDGFLHAAKILKVPPQSCLVFEDSLAGIQSAKAAQMKVIAITYRSNVAAQAPELADRAIGDFHSLENGFFEKIGQTGAST